MDIETLDLKQLLNAARIAEAAERYKDMCDFLHKLVETKCGGDETLTVDERNLLSVAYKNVVGTKRQSWRMLTQGNFQELDDKHLSSYRGIIERELEKICNEVIDLLELTTKVSKAKAETDDTAKEDVVFYLKMSGDYKRYLAEFQTDNEDHKSLAEKYYNEAIEVAKVNLPETHPTRLGLALNYSVCCYEILNKKDLACEIAKTAFDNAIEKLDTLNDSSYKDSTLIMQLLRDNLTLWTSEKEDAQDVDHD